MASKTKLKMGLLGKKIGMSQVFLDSGDCVGVTILEVGPCVVVQKKTRAHDGYEAIQIGFGEADANKLNRPSRGHFAKKNVKAFRHLKEIRLASVESFQPGQTLDINLFKVGDRVNVTGISKGKGFQGVIKRCGKAGGPGAHGSRFHRTTGSIGQRTYPAKVFKNMGMPGHMGDERVTIENLTVLKVLPKQNWLFIQGAVPGGKNALVVVKALDKDFESRAKVETAPAEAAPQA
ncbi:MAG: 50S ribosomal protein L3 [Deltaproteobacteria bacterium]|nr:50S ribosomal protein L3 [Deltaproteobacteria bacterium]